MDPKSYVQIEYLQTDLRNPSNLWDIDLNLHRLTADQLENIYNLHFGSRTPRFYLKIKNLKLTILSNLNPDELFKIERAINLLLDQQKFYLRSLDITWSSGNLRSIPVCPEITTLCLHDLDLKDNDFQVIISKYPQLRKIEIDTPVLPSEVLFTGILSSVDIEKSLQKQSIQELKTVPSFSTMPKLKSILIGPGSPPINKRCIAYGFATMPHLETLQFYLGENTDIRLRNVAQHLYHIKSLKIPDLQKDLQLTLDYVLSGFHEKRSTSQK